ncbi:MAG: ABC transporter substrate-binding protein [Chitinophagales bacterium]|nr:ABC transporter substrate-binding protein [Chitinophagales bacterium]
MKHLIWLWAICFVLTSCNGGKERGQLKVFRYNQASGITSLDPAFARDQANIWAINLLYNGLVKFDEQLNLQPALAKAWEISDDGLTYTFHLRTDVRFHDHEAFVENKGRLFTANDVVYSLSRIIDPSVASPGAWIFNGKISGKEAFTALDDSTFQLKLLAPFRPMLSLLAMQYCYVVPKEVAEKYGREFRIHPVGTGPFQLKVWKEDNVLVLDKNPLYFEQENGKQLPYLDGVRITFIKSKQSEYLKFMQGDLDFISGIDASTINDLLTKEGKLQGKQSAKIDLYKIPYLNTEYLGFLVNDSLLPTNSPLRKKEVRQAINCGFDRAAMIKYLRNNVGRPADAGFVPFGLPSFDAGKVKGYGYDPEKARQLLAKAGYPNGKGLPQLKLYTNASYQDLTNFIANQLKDIGIEVVLETVPPAFQRELMSKSKAEFFRASWIADYADAENYLSLFYGPNAAPPNYTRFRNVRFDSLYAASLNENDDAKRYALYQEMDRLVLEEAPIVPLFYDEVLRFVRKGVKGMQPNAMNLLDLTRVRIE